MPLFVPSDIIHLILDQISKVGDLARCCSTSKTFLSLARPILYHKVEMRGTGADEIVYNPRFQITTASTLLLSTLRKSNHLRQLVRQVSIVRDQAWSSWPLKGMEVTLEEILQEFLESMPLVRNFSLENFQFPLKLDLAVSQHQRRVRQERESGGEIGGEGHPTFRLALTGRKIEANTLSGVYEGFKIVPIGPYLITRDLVDLLRLSNKSLRYLSIPLECLETVSFFPHLTRLSIRLRQPSEDPVGRITQALSFTCTLESLQLGGTTSRKVLQELLIEGKLAISLPPLLRHLSLGWQLPSRYFSSFLERLPESTNLQRFDCRHSSQLEKSEIELGNSKELGGSELIEEFRQRGIRLSYDEEYTIW